jgi:hypothetical protein
MQSPLCRCAGVCAWSGCDASNSRSLGGDQTVIVRPRDQVPPSQVTAPGTQRCILCTTPVMLQGRYCRDPSEWPHRLCLPAEWCQRCGNGTVGARQSRPVTVSPRRTVSTALVTAAGALRNRGRLACGWLDSHSQPWVAEVEAQKHGRTLCVHLAGLCNNSTQHKPQRTPIHTHATAGRRCHEAMCARAPCAREW